MRVQRRAASTAALALAGVVAATMAAGPAQAKNPNSAKKMVEAVKTENVFKHLEALQGVADANDGNRGAGTSGYEASAAYVEKQLKAAGYAPTRQYFDFFYEEVHGTSLTEVSPGSGPIENNPMSYSQPTPAGGVTGTLVSPAVNVQGCDAAAYGGANLAGQIALVSRGTCSFAQKAQVAHQVGAARHLRTRCRGPGREPPQVVLDVLDGVRTKAQGHLLDVPQGGVGQAGRDRGPSGDRHWLVLARAPPGRQAAGVEQGQLQVVEHPGDVAT